MSRFCVAAAIAALLFSVTASAQQPGREQPTKPGETPPASPQKVVERPAVPPGQPANVRLDLTITDESSPGQPTKRIMTMFVADGQSGSIRSTGNQVHARLFVDASPQILSNGNVRVTLGLEYNPHQTPAEDTPDFSQLGGPKPIGGSSLTQRTTFVLEPGKPLVISQASDPLSDRKISVEVRATIVK